VTVTLAKWTIEDYHRIIEAGILDDRPVELLNGEIVEMVPEGIPHSASSTDSRDYLIRVLGDRAIVREGHPITIPESHSEPEPDLAIVEPKSEEYWEHHPYPENIFWLIEFSHSSLSKDLNEKAAIYARAGIREYWVVDLRRIAVVVMRDPDGESGTYGSQITISEGTIRPIAFPDVEIDLSRILRF